MSTQIIYKGEQILLIKGASEYILAACDKIHYWDNDEVTNLSEAVKKEITTNIHDFAK